MDKTGADINTNNDADFVDADIHGDNNIPHIREDGRFHCVQNQDSKSIAGENHENIATNWETSDSNRVTKQQQQQQQPDDMTITAVTSTENTTAVPTTLLPTGGSFDIKNWTCR